MTVRKQGSRGHRSAHLPLGLILLPVVSAGSLTWGLVSTEVVFFVTLFEEIPGGTDEESFL